MIFDPENSLYCKGLIGDPHYNRYKLPLTGESWGGNWKLPGDDRSRMFVRIGPFNIPGRGYDRDAGWSVYVCGTDDTEMRLSLTGPNMEPLAILVYNMITDFCTRSEMRTWSML